MQIANARVRLNKVGSDVPVKNLTPAEAMFLHILHGPYNGGLTFGEEFAKIEVVGEAMVQGTIVKKPAVTAKPAVAQVGIPGQPGFMAAQPAVAAVPAVTEEGLRPRTAAEELRRLAAKYAGARNKKNEPIINEVWPDKLNPKLPETFAEIPWTEVSQTGIETAPLNYATGGVASKL